MNDRAVTVTFSMAQSELAAFEAEAKRLAITRSDLLRRLSQRAGITKPTEDVPPKQCKHVWVDKAGREECKHCGEWRPG